MKDKRIIEIEIRKELSFQEARTVLAVYCDAKNYLTNCRSFEEVSEGLHKFGLQMFMYMQQYSKKPIKNLKSSQLLTDE